jgi:predicted nucleotidyltransferase
MSDTNPLNLLPDDPKFREILGRHKVVKISVFGSYALGEATKNSDIDFLVEFERGADLFDQVGLKLDLEELLGGKVDIVTPNSLSIYIRERILDQAVPV